MLDLRTAKYDQIDRNISIIIQYKINFFAAYPLLQIIY